MFHPIFRKHHRHVPDHGRRNIPFEAYWNRRRTVIAACFSLAVVALALGYYFAVHLPIEARRRLEFRREEAAMRERIEEARIRADEERQIRWERAQDAQFERNAGERELQAFRLDQCVAEAEGTYVQLWDRECRQRGLDEDCRLPESASGTLNGHLKDLKGECYLRYPQSPAGTADASDQT